MIMNISSKRILAGLALATSTFFSATASAAPIASWGWTTDGGFVNASDGAPMAATCSNGVQADCNLQFVNTGVSPSGLAGASNIMTWGTPSNTGNHQSGLQGIFGASGTGPFVAQRLGSDPIDIPAFEQIVTNGGWTTTGAAIHYNNVITAAGGYMQTSTLRTTFQLLTPETGLVADTNLGISFNETRNSGGCPLGNPSGSVCDDIFSLSGVLDPFSFTIDGQLYRTSFRFFNGEGASVEGNNIFTAEGGSSTVYVQGRIDTIPLPGVLALMGMGLIMIGWQGRARRKLI